MAKGERAVVERDAIFTERRYRVGDPERLRLLKLGAIAVDKEGFIEITEDGLMLIREAQPYPASLQALSAFEELSDWEKDAVAGYFDRLCIAARNRGEPLHPEALAALAGVALTRTIESSRNRSASAQSGEVPRAFTKRIDETEKVVPSNRTGYKNQFRKAGSLRRSPKVKHRS